MGEAEEQIRVYFIDHLHQLSYLSFDSEAAAVRQVRKVRDRFRRIVLWDSQTSSERSDAALESRIIQAAAS